MSTKVAPKPTGKGIRYGGRQKGTPNRGKNALKANLAKLYGNDFCAVSKIAHNAVILQHRVDEAEAERLKPVEDGEEPSPGATLEMLRETVNAWEKVAQYVEPKLKAIEVSNADEPADSEEARERLGELVSIGAARRAQSA